MSNLEMFEIAKSQDRPLVSVVMVVCDVERFLAESIESILCQTFGEFEFIIVDYGSTDSSKQIIVGHATRDRRVRLHEIPHCGLGEARNAACSLAQGRYIALMDADDVAMPDRLQLEVDFMEKHPNIGLLGGAVQWINGAGRALYVGRVPTNDKQIRREMAVHCPFWQPTVFLRKEAFVRAGGYRDAFVAEDYDLWMRVTEHFECANLEEVVLKYRMHPLQISIRKMKQQTLGILAAQRSAAMRQTGQPDRFNSIAAITPEILSELGVDEFTQERALVGQAQSWVRHMVLAGETFAALDAALELLRTKRTYLENWQVADLYLTVARLRWRRREFAESFRSAARAIRTRPRLLGRPLRPWLYKFGLIPAE